MSKPNRRRILWTGGFDSTALVLQTIDAGVRVVPFYLRQSGGDDWQKQIRERDARARIRHALPPEFARLLETDVELESAQFDEDARAIEGRIYRERCDVLGLRPAEAADFSPQLPWIVAAGRAVPDLEAGYVADDEPMRDGLLRGWLDSAIGLPLERFTKAEVLAHARRRGHAELLGLTWSCEGEIEETREEPCGRCLPCRGRIIPQIVRTS